ncbi:MAG: acyl-CoA dehydrogenase [Bryobacteraceae bacterium]|nr:acyl-CoA dehydrogenase [Bryobacteraceae bacterium]MDW8379608.1 acyl-CoA dehydrogenase [Bryobacterales bacterium]
MDLSLTPQQQAFREELRAWLAQNVPLAQPRSARETMQERFERLRCWQRRLYEAGWAGVAWPKEYGGRGASLIEQVLFLEEMARAQAPPLANTLGLALIGPTIIHSGTEEQKQRFLPKILSAEEIWCQGFSEPNAGSDVAALRTSAILEGDHFVVDGHKVWTSYGWAADWCALVVRTDPSRPKHQGLTYLLVDMRSPGVQVRPLRQMTGESEFAEVFFHQVRVPVGNVLGEVNAGWEVAIRTLMHERATLGATLTVVYRRSFDRLVELAKERRRNGKPLAEDPVIRQKLAQAYTELEIFRLNQMRAVSRASSSGTPGPEGSILKIFWSEYNQRFQQLAQEILGPHAMLEESSPEALDSGAWAYGYLRARGNTIEAGTSEIQRNIIGHFVLGLPKSY